ncbi:rho guanine nucleotide exchange factor 39-like [Antedon mediterranea]|uniref:rho guanine nucleotide exchange factor 39-like n=1 Tax=Antedon mediterranea TaxID=105859 RepID=UPI003AF6BCAB
MSQHTPSSTAAFQRMSLRTPKSTGTTPRSSVRTTRSTGRTPRSTSRTPKSTKRMPKSSGRTPKSSGRTPKSSGRTPKSSKRTPKSSGETPNSTRTRRGLRSERQMSRTPGSNVMQSCFDSILQTGPASARKRRIKRDKIVSEIFDSEKKYQQQLRMVIQNFYNPIRKTGILPEDVIDIIFSNITAIKAVNQELLIHLETFSVGKAFLLLVPYLKLYSTYANSFDRAASTLEDWSRKSEEFADFKRIQESKPSCRSLKLHALLITPVQRIPRYKLLLEELLEKTSESHKDYEQLKEATQQVNTIAHNINEQLKEHDNFQKMLSIQNCMVGETAPKILAPGRRFIKEGALKKVSKKGAKYHDRMFFLFSDMLVYAKPTFLENTDNATTFTCRCIINLLDCSVDCVLGDHKVPGAGALFKISFDNDSLLLFHEDQNIALSWVETIKDAISRVKQNSASLRKTISSSAISPMIKRGRVRTSLRYQTKRKRSDNENNAHMQDSLYPMRKYLQSLKLNQPRDSQPQENQPQKNQPRETPSKRPRLTRSQVEQNQSKITEFKFSEDDTVFQTPEKTLVDEQPFFTPATSIVKRGERRTRSASRNRSLHGVKHGRVTSAKKKRQQQRASRQKDIHVKSNNSNPEARCTIL